MTEATNTTVGGVTTTIVDGHAISSYVGEPAVTGEPEPVVTTTTLAPVAPVKVTEDSYSDSDGKGYEPTFNNTVRTVIYVAGLVAAAVGLGFVQFGDPAVGAYVSTVAGLITGGFGVAYNPIRMANK